ncbi:MAG: hypothetical protein WC521_08120 [Bdellovibrionales bacterium]
MKKAAETALLRKNLDVIIKKWKRVSPSVPTGGWIRNIREALDMTEDELGQMLKVTGSTISYLQISEGKGTIALATLQRVAKAMNCRFVYALVPFQSLEKTVALRRLRVTFDHYTAPSSLGAIGERQALILAFAAKIPRNRLWKDWPKAKEPVPTRAGKATTFEERKTAAEGGVGGLSPEMRREICEEAREVLRRAGINPDDPKAFEDDEDKAEGNAAGAEEEEELKDAELTDKPICDDTRPGDDDIRPGSKRWKEIMDKPKGYVPKFRD